MMTLRPLDKDNWRACANLEVSEAQKNNLPRNLEIIAEAQFYPQTKMVGIYHDEELVGFATYGMPEGEQIPKIFRFMIDKKFQGKGYGKEAMRLILNEFFTENTEAQVCYNPTSAELKQFYASLGYKEQGIIPGKNPEGRMLAVVKKEDFEGMNRLK